MVQDSRWLSCLTLVRETSYIVILQVATIFIIQDKIHDKDEIHSESRDTDFVHEVKINDVSSFSILTKHWMLSGYNHENI